MKHIDKVFEECLYRFKGKSCAECPLNCLNKDKNGLYQQIQQLKTENDKLRNGLKEITVYTTNHCTDKRALYLEQIVSDCNKAEQKLEKIRKLCTSKYFYHVNGNTVIHTADILEII